MPLKLFLFFCLNIFFVTIALSQRRITTLSGQKIILLQNGKWIRDENTHDTLSLTGISEPKNISALSAADKENEGIKILLETAKLKEIENVVLLDDLDKEVAIKEVMLSQARQMNDKLKEATIKSESAEFKSRLKTAEKIYKSTAELIYSAQNLKHLNGEQKRKKMTELGLALNVDTAPYISEISLPETQSLPLIKADKNKPDEIENKPKTIRKLKVDNCNIIRNEQINKQHIVETKPEFLFSFTPDKLKNYFKEKDLLNADVSVIKIGKDKFLRLTIKLYSKDAAKNYGIIHLGSLIKIFFISGKSISLTSASESDGSLENYTGKVIYNVDYLITGDDTDMIYDVPVDKIGIMWSSGFEMYDVYNVDVLMRLNKCLKSNSN
jgi:hypothetical protein